MNLAAADASPRHLNSKEVRADSRRRLRIRGSRRGIPFGGILIQIAVVLLACVDCSKASEAIAEKTNVVIGLLLPPEEPQAVSLREGVVLGVEHANKTGGVHVQLIIRGRAGQWGADGVEAARMVTDDGAQGLIAPPDGAATHLVLQVSGRTSVPVISLCADSSVSQAGIPWMVRIVPRTVEEAQALFTNIHARRWVAVIPDARAGREMANDLKEAAVSAGCFIENMIEVGTSLTNVTRLAKLILTNRPGAIALWLDPKAAGTLAKSLRAVGFGGTLAGSGRLRSAEFSAAAGGAGEGLVVPSPGLEKNAGGAFQQFSNAFRGRFGREPDATAAASYDATTLLIQILRQHPDHRAHEAFPIGFSLTGATGVLTFDSQGNRKVNLQLLESRGGRFIPAGTGLSE